MTRYLHVDTRIYGCGFEQVTPTVSHSEVHIFKLPGESLKRRDNKQVLTFKKLERVTARKGSVD